MFLVDLDEYKDSQIMRGVDGEWYEFYEWGGSKIKPIEVDESFERNLKYIRKLEAIDIETRTA